MIIVIYVLLYLCFFAHCCYFSVFTPLGNNNNNNKVMKWYIKCKAAETPLSLSAARRGSLPRHTLADHTRLFPQSASLSLSFYSLGFRRGGRYGETSARCTENGFEQVRQSPRGSYHHVIPSLSMTLPFRSLDKGLQSAFFLSVRHFSTTLHQRKEGSGSISGKASSNAIHQEESSKNLFSPPPSDLPNLFEPMFLDELRECIFSFPFSEWVPLSELYARLSPTAKKEYVRPHKTLRAVLQEVARVLEIVLHEDGVFWCRGTPPPPLGMQEEDDKHSGEAREVGTSSYQGQHPDSTLSSEKIPGGLRVSTTPKGSSCPTSASTSSSSSSSHPSVIVHPSRNPFSPLLSSTVGDGHPEDNSFTVDFYYDVGLTKIPPPPKDFDVTPASLGHIQPKEDGSVISLKSFVTHIPPFFVPLTEVLEKMPGYTEEHIEKYFKSPAVEMIQLNGQRYIRLYGGYGKIGLEGCEASEELFKHYKPKLALASSFVKAFDGVTDKWMPLETLLARADPETVEQLPFKGPEAIIYFAQMQHIFAFAVDAKNGGAVLLRPPGFGGLESHTTPTPKSVNFIVRFLPLEGTCDIAQLEEAIPPAIKSEIEEYYGGLAGCLESHGPLLYVEHNVVMLTNYKRRLHVASLPLEDQLEIALQKRDKGKIRSLRRRIAFRDHPSHAFHDPDNLAREIARFLPRKGFVTLKQFMKRTIPEELLFFMPRKTHNFFCNYPQYFTQFEFQQPGAWCICRPEEPLPKGVIRQNFSDGDIIRLIAQHIQQKGPRACAQLLVNLPRGAHDAIKKKHGGMYYFVTKHPEYFNVMIGSETQNASGSAVVHLLKVPGSELSDTTTLTNSLSHAKDTEDDSDDFDVGDDD